MYRFAPILGALDFALSVTSARADIFQWEYINPADPSQGTQQSTTLAPDGAGVDAVPGANLSYRNLTMAYLIGVDLTGAYGYSANLAIADFRQANLANAHFADANLTGANFSEANLTNVNFAEYSNFCETDVCYPNHAVVTAADFTDADVRGANLGFTGITLAQLYSTASYQAKDLSGINLNHND